jgi:hypothetical protein
MNEVIVEQEQKQRRQKFKGKSPGSAEAFRLMELIEEERLIKDQLAEFWEPRFLENRPLQNTSLI